MQPASIPRVALFTESFDEASHVARTATALEAFASKRDRPLLVVHGGEVTQLVESGSVVRLELARSRRCAMALEPGRRFDLTMWRHRPRVAQVLRWFGPDVLHVTGPSDLGWLGAWLGRRLRLPAIGTWQAPRGGFDRRWLALMTRLYPLPNIVAVPDREDALYHAYDLAIAQACRGPRALEDACATLPMKQSA
jgi:hypothetical protein